MLLHYNFFHKLFFRVLWAIFFVVIIAPLYAQTTHKTLELYHCINDFPSQTLQFVNKAGITKVPMFDGRYIDPENDEVLNADFLKQAVIREIPNAKDTGLAILDWEGAAFETLYKAAAGSDSFKAIFKQFQQALSLCQKLRPKMKWGYYYLPATNYWTADTSAWQQFNKKLLPLMKQCDILYPSVYNHYFDTTTFTYNRSYITYNIKQSLKIGIALKKKVIVFVWHRIHEGNQNDGLKLIPEKKFYESLKQMTDVKVGAKRIDGLMWFSADTYFLSVKPSLLPAENPVNKSITVHYDDIVKKYTALFLKIKDYYSRL